MQVLFTSRFKKDIDALNDKNLLLSINEIIIKLETVENLFSFPNIKKLIGNKNVYRIRIGDYRLGFFLNDEVITIARFVHRKDMYKFFP